MTQFESLFPRISKLEKEGIKTPYTDLIRWFNKNHLQLNYNDTDEEFYAKLDGIAPLTAVVEENASDLSSENQNFCKELVLWALTISNKIDKSESQNAFTFDSPGIGQFLRN
jgi:magnesium chelatase subunit I